MRLAYIISIYVFISLVFFRVTKECFLASRKYILVTPYFTSAVTKTPQDSRVKKKHYGDKRKRLPVWEKCELNSSSKQKVQH